MEPIRVAQINLDDDQEVTSVVVVIDRPYLGKVAALIGAELAVQRSERGDTELWVELTARQVLDAHTASRNTKPSMDGYVPGMTSNLGLVIYGLMENDY